MNKRYRDLNQSVRTAQGLKTTTIHNVFISMTLQINAGQDLPFFEFINLFL